MSSSARLPAKVSLLSVLERSSLIGGRRLCMMSSVSNRSSALSRDYCLRMCRSEWFPDEGLRQKVSKMTRFWQLY